MMAITNFQPLYKQVYDLLTARLVKGEWKPAEPLPSEMALAEQLGVSQGTVRKALNQMVAEKLLDRRQGKGTFVAEHTQESSLFRFFRHRLPGGESVIPETEVLDVTRTRASSRAQLCLSLSASDEVTAMTRLRSVLGQPTIYEVIYQPQAIFPNLDQQAEIPNSLYTLYQEKYGVSIVEVKDEIHAAALPAEAAEPLGLQVGTPVLMIERASVSLDGRTVEWSQSYCSSENYVYAVTLR